jgi:hypothetical protein
MDTIHECESLRVTLKVTSMSESDGSSTIIATKKHIVTSLPEGHSSDSCDSDSSTADNANYREFQMSCRNGQLHTILRQGTRVTHDSNCGADKTNYGRSYAKVLR